MELGNEGDQTSAFCHRGELWLEPSWSDGDNVCVSPLSCPIRGKGRAVSWGSTVIWGSTLRRVPCFVESSVLIFRNY